MVGASGTFTNLAFLNPTQVPGLYDSIRAGGLPSIITVFLKRHYIGGDVSVFRNHGLSTESNRAKSRRHTVFLFYTIYLMRNFLLIVIGWPPALRRLLSLLCQSTLMVAYHDRKYSWQGAIRSFSASYLRRVTGGGGLVGVFQSNNATAFARWQLHVPGVCS